MVDKNHYRFKKIQKPITIEDLKEEIKKKIKKQIDQLKQENEQLEI